jgi:hypothetical protein
MKRVDVSALTWTEIELAPETAGVYAWYSRLLISRADIDEIIRRILAAKTVDEQRARAAVEDALDRFVFNPYRESPYRVQLRGPLKPRFAGEVAHEPSKSDSLVSRLVKTPERFRTVAEVLGAAAPAFTAPLYIGMATNLRNRLRAHKNKIADLRDLRHAHDNDDSAEAGFAKQVVARGFDPTNLFVHVTEVSVDTGEHNDIENILNRINYPIFGRN